MNISYTTITDLFFFNPDGLIYCAVRTKSSTIIHANFILQKFSAVTLRTVQLQCYSPEHVLP
jgi:hypothetical protein